ncbi:MAG: hypothetical protein AAF481_09555 [Acidobacteriota bacterium]
MNARPGVHGRFTSLKPVLRLYAGFGAVALFFALLSTLPIALGESRLSARPVLDSHPVFVDSTTGHSLALPEYRACLALWDKLSAPDQNFADLRPVAWPGAPSEHRAIEWAANREATRWRPPEFQTAETP